MEEENVQLDYRALLDQFHPLNAQLLRAAYHLHLDGCLAKIILEFEQHSLIGKAVVDDDTIAFEVVSNSDHYTNGCVNRSSFAPWSAYIGKTFGWGWITVNQQGYLDGILLSFDGLTPQVMLNVIASSIKESACSELN